MIALSIHRVQNILRVCGTRKRRGSRSSAVKERGRNDLTMTQGHSLNSCRGRQNETKQFNDVDRRRRVRRSYRTLRARASRL